MTLSDQTQNMLRLLTQVILADGHIMPSEIEALMSGVKTLGLSGGDGALPAPPQIEDWLTDYSKELNTSDSKLPKEVALTRLILSLAEWPDKQAVVETLENISRADTDFHKEEKRLISIVKAYWQHDGLDAPGSKIEA